MSPEIASKLSIQDRLDNIPDFSLMEKDRSYIEFEEHYNQRICLIKEINEDIWPAIELPCTFEDALKLTRNIGKRLIRIQELSPSQKEKIKETTQKLCRKINFSPETVSSLFWVSELDIRVLEQLKKPVTGRRAEEGFLGITKLKAIKDNYPQTEEQLLITKNVIKSKLTDDDVNFLIKRLQKSEIETELTQEIIDSILKEVSAENLKKKIGNEVNTRINAEKANPYSQESKEITESSFQEITTNDSAETITLKRELNTLIKKILLEDLCLSYLKPKLPERVKDFYSKIWTEYKGVFEAGEELGLAEASSRKLIIDILNHRSLIKKSKNSEYLNDQQRIEKKFKDHQVIKNEAKKTLETNDEAIYADLFDAVYNIERLKIDIKALKKKSWLDNKHEYNFTPLEKKIFKYFYFDNGYVPENSTEYRKIQPAVASMLTKRSMVHTIGRLSELD